MKQNTLANIVEFQDVLFDGAFKNLCDGCQYIQGPGLPDICIVYKRFKKAINLNPFSKSSTQQHDKQTTSSFHFIQGLCPSSQAEISAYFSQVIASQETDQQYKMFSNGEFEIFKIIYGTWDIFSKTLVISQMEIPQNLTSLSQFKSYGINSMSEQRIINITEKEIEGAYVSSVLRTIDKECRIPLAGKFYRHTKLCNSKQILDFLRRYFALITPLKFKYEQTSQFSSLDNTLYQINWTLAIIVQYLERTKTLEILLEYLGQLRETLMTQLVTSILAYKAKFDYAIMQRQYKECIASLAAVVINHPKLYFAQYLQAKSFLKLDELEKAFTVLQNLLPRCINNVHVWTTLVNKPQTKKVALMRKKSNYAITLLLLNRAIQCNHKEANFAEAHAQIYLNNYRVLCGNKNLQQVNQLEQIFEPVTPILLDQIDSYYQLVQCPASDVLSMKQRSNEQNVKKLDQWFKQQLKSGYRISQEQYEVLINGKAFETHPAITTELKKMHNLLGTSKLQNLINNVFQQAKVTQQHQSNQLELRFELLTNHTDLDLSGALDNLNRSVHIPKIMDEVAYTDEDEIVQPSFLKGDSEADEKLRRSVSQQGSRFQKRSQSVKNASNTNKQFLKAFKGHQSVKGKKSVQIKTIIQETANESLESERMRPITPKLYALQQASQAPSSAVPAKKVIPSLESLLMGNSTQFELRRRNEPINPVFDEAVRSFLQLVQTLDAIFTPSAAKQQMKQNAAKSKGSQPAPMFKSNLKQALKNKSHLAERYVEIREFYILPQFVQSESNYATIQRQETVFLFKCAQIAVKLRRREMAQQICAKLNVKVISVQLTNLLLEITASTGDPRLLIKFLQRCLHDFQDCGVQSVSALPLWMEEHIVRVVRIFGANCLLGLLVNAESDFSFYLIKQAILAAENLK